ncbi:MAG: Eco57I restriction-modification methylase domain-containing protein [Candidatus Hodarchaeota archaeon]
MASKSTLTKYGAVPTPNALVGHIIDFLIKFWVKNTETYNKRNTLNILDNSVGDARFLIKFSLNLKKNDTKGLGEKIFYHGVDINPNAIELAKITVKNTKSLDFRRFSLKVGNALLGYIYPPNEWEETWSNEMVDSSYFSTYNLNSNDVLGFNSPFHWFKEWPKVLENGGFDIILGNPPYGINFSQSEKNLYRQIYQTCDPEIESYILFIERSIKLLQNGGLIGLVVPSNLATNLRYQKIRNFILKNTRILKIINLDKKVFSRINVEPCIIFLQRFDHFKNVKPHEISFEHLKYKIKDKFEVISRITESQSNIYSNVNQMFLPNPKTTISNILEKIERNSPILNDFVKISRGIELGFHSPITSDKKQDSNFVPLIAGRSIRKFRISPNKRYIQFNLHNKPIFKDHALYVQPKLVLRRIGHELIAAFDKNNLFCLCDVYLLTLKPNQTQTILYYLEAILNSTLMSFYLKNRFTSIKKIFPKIPIKYLKELPIRITKSPSNIISLTEQLHKQPWLIHGSNDQYSKLIKNLNNEIFKLYELSPDEQVFITEHY